MKDDPELRAAVLAHVLQANRAVRYFADCVVFGECPELDAEYNQLAAHAATYDWLCRVGAIHLARARQFEPAQFTVTS